MAQFPRDFLGVLFTFHEGNCAIYFPSVPWRQLDWWTPPFAPPRPHLDSGRQRDSNVRMLHLVTQTLMSVASPQTGAVPAWSNFDFERRNRIHSAINLICGGLIKRSFIHGMTIGENHQKIILPTKGETLPLWWWVQHEDHEYPK